MNINILKLELYCNSDAVNDLREILPVEDQPRFIERRDLSGDAATWIVLATLGSQIMPHILNYLTKRQEMGSVKRIKIEDQFGKIEIDNPSAQDIEDLRPRLLGEQTRNDS